MDGGEDLVRKALNALLLKAGRDSTWAICTNVISEGYPRDIPAHLFREVASFSRWLRDS